MNPEQVEHLKREAARRALAEVRDGMVLGLGSGSTSAQFVELLGERLAAGDLRSVRGVPTSEKTAHRARELGIPLVMLGDSPRLDLAVDGADEVDPALNLIKGLGKALLREKLVEIHADRFLVIVDETKVSARLGTLSPLPVELVTYAWEATLRWLNTIGCRAELWRDENGVPFVTDNSNYLARCWFPGGIIDTAALADQLAHRPGIVEHGLFLDMASAVIIAGTAGIQVLERKP